MQSDTVEDSELHINIACFDSSFEMCLEQRGLFFVLTILRRHAPVILMLQALCWSKGIGNDRDAELQSCKEFFTQAIIEKAVILFKLRSFDIDKRLRIGLIIKDSLTGQALSVKVYFTRSGILA